MIVWIIILIFAISGWLLFAWQFRKNSINKVTIETREIENWRLKKVIDNERKIFSEQLRLVSTGKIDADTLNSIISRLHKEDSNKH